MAEFSFGGEFVWRPDPAVVEHTNLTRFMRRHGITTMDGSDPALARRCHAGSGTPSWPTWTSSSTSPTRQIADFSRGIEWPAWCVGGR